MKKENKRTDFFEAESYFIRIPLLFGWEVVINLINWDRPSKRCCGLHNKQCGRINGERAYRCCNGCSAPPHS